jgi:transcriptional regulator with GAF, ATPase, and Fis domain
MGRLPIWVHPSGVSEEQAARLSSALQNGGLDPVSWDGRSQRTPGIVLLQTVRPVEVELLRFASDSGNVPVFACVEQTTNVEDVAGWELLEAGAADLFVGIPLDEIAEAVISRLDRWNGVATVASSALVGEHCPGNSRTWKHAVWTAASAAILSTAPLLITGESGTGKEVMARLIHRLDLRPDKADLVLVDCTTIVRELSGSELFGHVRGAFTGAHADRDGAFALADGGTLFLDEIGELPLPLQAELLRVVQEGTFRAVGSNVWKQTHFRLVSATHRDLESDVQAGRFRHDLFHRLTGWRLHLPPLRDRPEDIPILARSFIAQFSGAVPPPAMTRELERFLCAQLYPGNVRQLRQVIQRIMHRHSGAGPLTLGLVAPEDRPTNPGKATVRWVEEMRSVVARAIVQGATLKDVGRNAADLAVSFSLSEEGGNLRRAARRLGITDRALQMRVATLRALPSEPLDECGPARAPQ